MRVGPGYIVSLHYLVSDPITTLNFRKTKQEMNQTRPESQWKAQESNTDRHRYLSRTIQVTKPGFSTSTVFVVLNHVEGTLIR